MKEKATIFDYARMCKHFDDNCQGCPMFHKKIETGLSCGEFIRNCLDKANEIILNWCKEHPVKTRQDKFLELFPNANTELEFIDICPHVVDCDYACKNRISYVGFDCNDCKKSYWLAEVE